MEKHCFVVLAGLNQTLFHESEALLSFFSVSGRLIAVGLDDRMLSASHQFSDHEIGLLAELEHNCWNVEELLIGFKPCYRGTETPDRTG